jgi:hypothetical protein
MGSGHVSTQRRSQQLCRPLRKAILDATLCEVLRDAMDVTLRRQFRFTIQYQQHPEAKSLAPDGTPCVAETRVLLQRAHVIAGEIRYIGKETDRKWEEGEEISVLEFAATEYGRKGKVIASEEVKVAIQEIGINKCARESGLDRKNFIRKLVRALPV